MSDQSLYADQSSDTIEIAGKKFPRWMIYVAGGILVIGVIYLISKGRSSSTSYSEGDGLLAEEYNQRLKEFYEANTKPKEEPGQYPGTATTPPTTEPVTVTQPPEFIQEYPGRQETFEYGTPAFTQNALVSVEPANLAQSGVAQRVLSKNEAFQKGVPHATSTSTTSISGVKKPTVEQVLGSVKSAQLKKAAAEGSVWSKQLNLKQNESPGPAPLEGSNKGVTSSEVLEAMSNATKKKQEATTKPSSTKSAPKSTTKSTTQKKGSIAPVTIKKGGTTYRGKK